MTCPVCGGKTKVIDSKSDCESIHRKKRCDDCGHIFYTAEYEAESSERFYELKYNYHKERRLNGKGRKS